MAKNILSGDFELVELFGKPILFTNNRVDRETVPEGWYCYDLRGSDYDPGTPISMEERVVVNHAGTILSPEKIPFAQGKNYRNIRGKMNFICEDLTISEFCEIHDLHIVDDRRGQVMKQDGLIMGM